MPISSANEPGITSPTSTPPLAVRFICWRRASVRFSMLTPNLACVPSPRCASSLGPAAEPVGEDLRQVGHHHLEVLALAVAQHRDIERGADRRGGHAFDQVVAAASPACR